MGGEKQLQRSGRRLQLGSPPHGRGKELSGVAHHYGDGITPAWAGKSVFALSARLLAKDHPRMGGEKWIIHQIFISQLGSPPHGRGKVQISCALAVPFGITPAWAGKRVQQPLLLHPSWDHPRMGGEKEQATNCSQLPLGSPPHGRGKDAVQGWMRATEGITPAWAGKRLKRSHRSGIFISGPIPFHSVLHRPAGSGGSRAGRDGAPAGQPQNTGPA